MRRITNGFDKLTFADFRQKLVFIVSKMTGNANFPAQQPDVQALATAATAYALLDDAAAGGDEEARLKRDAARELLIAQLHSLGRHVTAVADDSVEKLASSGFNYTQDRKTSPDMTKPAPPRVELGVNNGELVCRTSKQPGMKSVNFYVTTDTAALAAGENVNWDIISSNNVKYTFDSLTAGQRYFIRVGLVGVRGQEVISDPVSYIPQ